MYSAQWLNLLEEGTNNFFAANFLSHKSTIGIWCKIIFFEYFGQAQRCFGVHQSGLAEFRYFWLQKWQFSYINQQYFLHYCPVQQGLGRVEVIAVNYLGEKGFMIIYSHHCATPCSFGILSLKMAVLIGILSFFPDQYPKYPTSTNCLGHCLIKLEFLFDWSLLL